MGSVLVRVCFLFMYCDCLGVVAGSPSAACGSSAENLMLLLLLVVLGADLCW